MKVEIWSDVACPYCYVGKRSFERAFARFEHADSTEVVWRAFQLGPGMPKTIDGDIHDVLAAKYGATREQAKEMSARVATMAAHAGLECDFDAIRPTNTLDAHRLAHLASLSGKAAEANELLFEAYFRDGLNVSDRDVLVGIGERLELDTDEVAALLDGDRFADVVVAEQEQAHELGIAAVPTFVFDRASAVPGAQQEDLLLEALRTAWAAGSGE